MVFCCGIYFLRACKIELAKVDELCGLVNTINGQVHHKVIVDLVAVQKIYGVFVVGLSFNN